MCLDIFSQHGSGLKGVVRESCSHSLWKTCSWRPSVQEGGVSLASFLFVFLPLLSQAFGLKSEVWANFVDLFFLHRWKKTPLLKGNWLQLWTSEMSGLGVPESWGWAQLLSVGLPGNTRQWEALITKKSFLCVSWLGGFTWAHFLLSWP